ncbi:hypothetical protein [Catellatospora methionotrophica]|uniref:hypothetical protein n=1 Tax=Catellatospora methionotrophica TaxID=121620 RepID=UPI0033CE1AE6
MSERELIEGLARLAEPVRPAEDPYGRLMRRHRRSRRTAVAGWSTGAVAVAVAALLGPIGIQNAATPVPSGPSQASSDSGTPLTPWVRRLIDTPVRGGLAGDRAFLDELTGLLQRHDIGAVPGGQVRILYAGDVGETRLVAAVRSDGAFQQGVLATAARGASPGDLNAGDEKIYTPGEPAVRRFELRPFTGIGVGRTTVLLAPSGCVIASTDTRTGQVGWTDEPTGDFALIDKSWTWQQVTCDGKVRFRGRAPGEGVITAGRSLTDAEIAAGLVGARGTVEPAMAAQHLRTSVDGDTEGSPRLLYMGRPPRTGLPVYGVVVSFRRDGWWQLSCWAADGSGMSMTTSTDLGAPDRVIALPLDLATTATPDAQQRTPVLMIAPRNAVKVRVLGAGDRLLDTVTLTDGVGTTMQRPDGTFTLRAYDKSGNAVGLGSHPLPTERLPAPFLDDWS